MGQNLSSVNNPNIQINQLISELNEFKYDRMLGSSPILKTILCDHPQGKQAVKVVVKNSSQDLHKFQNLLMNEKEALKDVMNVLPYTMVLETERAGYAVRQYISNNLYDRISTRPFLTLIEMKWITFQLLTALSQIHAKSIYHGDIKTENILLTNWNLTFLADFSSFKPVYLPDDNPTNFSLFFDSSSRRSCYISPERFVSSSERLFRQDDDIGLGFEMDIFSAGCTLAEMYLEGRPMFTLSQLLKYRAGEYDHENTLQRVEDRSIREMIKSMISLDPRARKQASVYLVEYRGKVFPGHFYEFQQPFVAKLADTNRYLNDSKFKLQTPDGAKVVDADARIEYMYDVFHTITSSCDISIGNTDPNSQDGEIFPLIIEIPNFCGLCSDLSFGTEASDLAVLYSSMVTTFLQSCLYPTSKVYALELLLVLGMQLSDELAIDRIVPFLVLGLSDNSVIVRTKSILILTQIVLNS